jgi:hypothetical protein
MTLGEQNRKLFAKLALIAAGMFGFGYALVPFYYQICAAWGINSLGEVRAEPLNSQIDKTRLVTIEFDANAHGLPWRFKPLVNHIQVHPGELATVEYEVLNERSVAVTGVFQEDRVLLLHAADARARREAAHAGDFRGRPEAAARREQHRAVVHFFRSRRPRGQELMEIIVKRASFLDTVKTVLSGFIGVRKRSDHERAQLNPVHVIIVALLFVVLFIFTIRTIVRLVVG